MEIRFQASPKEVSGMNTEELRSNFLLQQLMKADELTLVYSHYDRVIVGGVKPVKQKVSLPNEAELRAEYFLVFLLVPHRQVIKNQLRIA